MADLAAILDSVKKGNYKISLLKPYQSIGTGSFIKIGFKKKIYVSENPLYPLIHSYLYSLTIAHEKLKKK